MAFVPIIAGMALAGLAGSIGGALLGNTPPPANKASLENINNIINNVVTNFNPQTTSNLDYSNYLGVNNNSIAINNTQYIEAINDIESIVTASQLTDLSTTLNNNISQDIERNNIALLSSFGNMLSNNNIDLSTKLSNKVENMNLTNIIPMCVSNQELANRMVVENGSVSIGNAQLIKNNFYQKCTSDFNNTLNTVSDITNTISQKAKVTEENPLGFLSDMFGNLSMVFVIFFILIVVVGMVIVYKQFFGNKDNNNASNLSTSKTQLAKTALKAVI